MIMNTTEQTEKIYNNKKILNMKKVLLFGSGFVAGVLATFLVAYLISVANKPNDGLIGLTIFSEKGECITTSKKNKSCEIEIMQVVESDKALGHIRFYSDKKMYGGEIYRNYDIGDDILILLINNDGKTYYDDQKIDVSDKCVRQIGTYQYTAKMGKKTVPAVVIEYTNNSENEIEAQNQVQYQYVEVKGKKGNATLYIGMSKDSVQVLVGKPDEVRMNTIGNSTYENWGYKINNKYGLPKKYQTADLTIDFRDGKLKGVQQD